MVLIVVTVGTSAGISYQAIRQRRIKKELEDAKLQAECVEGFDIDDVFLIYKDGRLISHVSKKASLVDDQIFGGMLIAIQSFVKDSFQAEEGLTSFEFGSRKIILEKGNHLFLTVALSGVEPKILKPQMRDLIQKIEGLYAGIVEQWDGNTASFKDVEHMLVSLFAIKEGLKIKSEKEEVKLLSGVEFYSGYVRLKMAIKNGLSTGIRDVQLSISYDDKVLHIDHIEPEYPMRRPTVFLDNIEKDEKRTVAFYLDPKICQESHVDGKVTFTDIYGNKGEVQMKRRLIDIVCPIFYTKETVNIAMLKRLLRDLKYNDSRLFEIKSQSALKALYKLSVETLLKHDVKFVREFMESDPYAAEAWFYGEIKDTEEKIILRVAARAEKHYLEIFVASSNLAFLTGLLAELGNNLKKEIIENGIFKEEIHPTTDNLLKEKIEREKLLLDKYTETERGGNKIE
jgi:hypothetical protein